MPGHLRNEWDENAEPVWPENVWPDIVEDRAGGDDYRRSQSDVDEAGVVLVGIVLAAAVLAALAVLGAFCIGRWQGVW